LISTGSRTPHGGSGKVHSWNAQVELLKLQQNGQFPDELVKIKVTQITKSLCNLPDVLEIGIKEISS
jgi:hypothetical protein